MKKPIPYKVSPELLARREDIFRVYRDMGPTRSYDRLLAAIDRADRAPRLARAAKLAREDRRIA